MGLTIEDLKVLATVAINNGTEKQCIKILLDCLEQAQEKLQKFEEDEKCQP